MKIMSIGLWQGREAGELPEMFIGLLTWLETGAWDDGLSVET